MALIARRDCSMLVNRLCKQLPLGSVSNTISSLSGAEVGRRSFSSCPQIRAVVPSHVTSSIPQIALSSTKLFSQRTSLVQTNVRWFSSEVKSIPVPSLGDSITEGTVVSFTKAVGDSVQADEVVAVLETDKVSVDIRSPASGAVAELSAKPGDTVKVGDTLFKLSVGAAGTAAAPKAEAPKAAAPKAEAPKAEAPKAEAPKAAAKAEAPKPAAAAPAKAPAAPKVGGVASRNETRVPMTRMRLRIGERLKSAQNTYAMLTTFNEIDMTNAMAIRSKFKDDFQKKHGAKLGFMSFFVKAATNALVSQPVANAVIDGKDIVYRDYVDISVAVSTPTGLVVPVLRNTETMGFHDVESSIAALGEKARKGQIAIEDMTGGTFTISNGGVYGSLMGTPIINSPQSAILGMHGIFKRPVVIDDKIEIRPMMYVALTYDHRLLDGSDAVTFLRKIKDTVEDPVRLLLDV